MNSMPLYSTCGAEAKQVVRPMIKQRLPHTREYEGCERVELYVDHDNLGHLVPVEQWASREAYDPYRA